VVVMSDTTIPPPALREALKGYVNAGGLLILFPGVRTNATGMNEALGSGPGGANILPATYGQLMKPANPEQAAEGFSFAPEGYLHPVLQVFKSDIGQGKNVGFEPVHTAQYLRLGVAPDSETEVILRYAKPDGTPGDPAVVKGNFGRGQVVMFASTADIAWNTFGPKPAFVPFMHELTYYAMGRDMAAGVGFGSGTFNPRLGDSIRLPVDAVAPGSWIGPRDTRVNVTAETDKQGRSMLTSPPLVLAGTYAPPAAGSGTADARPAVAVNPDPEEADIRHVSSQQMAAALGIDAKQITEQPAAIADIAAPVADDASSTLGIGLVGGALLLFLIETVLAMLFSTYR